MAKSIQRKFAATTDALSNAAECLGIPFESDQARRAYFSSKLREKLQDPAFRKLDGFPIADDEHILAMSDPPYYTACPNPFLPDFVQQYGHEYVADTDDYQQVPFAADVSEGKSDALYNVHSYHTKVPFKAIIRYLLHYTKPHDLILDGFCGTGMAGVAAQLCADRRLLESMGLVVRSDDTVIDDASGTVSAVGPRFPILIDLSPAATFLAYNYNFPADLTEFEDTAAQILSETEEEFAWMYETAHPGGSTTGTINYVVWSEVCACPDCSREVVYLEGALDKRSKKVRKDFPCPHCMATMSGRTVVPLFETVLDPALQETVRIPKRIPCIINYTSGRKRYDKSPDAADRERLQRILQLPPPRELPTDRLPDMQMTRVGRMQTTALTHIHHFFLPRTAHIVAALWRKVSTVEKASTRALLEFWLESQFVNLSVRNRYRPSVSFPYNPLNGVYYIPQMVSEASVFTAYRNKLKRIVTAFSGVRLGTTPCVIGTGSAHVCSVPDSSIDYIFTDPPFGENIYYSDLNFFIESWFRVFTSVKSEAIVDRVRDKDLFDYQRLMEACFREYFRVLKPGRWMTVEFHNSSNSVWNAIQEALQHVGFVVADVRTLDKQQGSFQQIVSGNTVKRDLIMVHPTKAYVV